MGAAAGDGVADVVEAGLNQPPPSFHLIHIAVFVKNILCLFLMYCDYYCVVSCIFLPLTSAF